MEATATFYALLGWRTCAAAVPMALGAVAGLLLLLVVARVVTVASDAFPGSCLYVGRVRHTRLKGGAVHAFQYPIFFSFIDLDEIDRVGWGLWPIFKVNGGWGSFCSLDYSNHLRDIPYHTPTRKVVVFHSIPCKPVLGLEAA